MVASTSQSDGAPAGDLPRAAQRVAAALHARGHRDSVRMLSDSTRSAAEAAAALGVAERQIVKSLVFRARDSGGPVLALVCGDSRVDLARLQALVGEPVDRPDASWVKQHTGFSIGGVPPLAHTEALRAVADLALVALDELWAAAGTPHAVFRLRGSDLVSLTGAELAEIAA
jgi:prolyl-tRNA editing enzyme YbaK/EbsC (Cys-tRNA(Pro) deacylase)